MSRQLVSRSPDLLHLQEEGYDLRFRSTYLLVQVPYVRSDRTVDRGFLVSSINVVGDRTGPVTDHVAYFVGAHGPRDQPCDEHGQPLGWLIHQQGPVALGDDFVASCGFSHKPATGYPDYYEKMTTYAAMLAGPAHVIDPDTRLATFPPIAANEEESVFRYFDSATSRARIGAVTDKLHGQRLAIVGLGGTGSYVLDCLAKTPVAEIHLYDADHLVTHNAFRSPGAATFDELLVAPTKVEHLQGIYDEMHRHVIAHPEPITAGNVAELDDMDFVFIAMDSGPAKRIIMDRLLRRGITFIDTGIGVYQTGDQLAGMVRTTTVRPGAASLEQLDQVIDFADPADDEYDQNIQIVELNMLNAALAVLAWKKHLAYYVDFEHEFTSVYTIDGNHLLNEEPRA